jgi:AcrR family transcriptional regulator
MGNSQNSTATAEARARVLAPDAAVEATATRILEATARCLGRWGIAKTTVDDLARDAGVSRATVYRYFPGGKDQLVLAVGIYEEGRFYARLAPLLEDAATLADALTLAISEASRFLRDHEVLATLLEHEPEKILPYLAFDRIGPLLYRTTAFLSPYLERFVEPADVAPIAEWATRLVLSFWLEPSARFELTTPAGARHLVDRYLMPGVAARATGTRSHVIDLTQE